MAERKATNKYYPPSWDPSKGSINRFVGQHPLRARAAKMGIGVIVVRFEMPFNVWCLSCQKHIGQGTRYNAEKKKIGHYYSSPIYSFNMTCHLCSGKIEIHTDPKLGEYVIIEGARKRVEEFSAKDAETIELIDDKTREKMESDAFYKLEHGQSLKEKIEEKEEIIEKIMAVNQDQWADPWTVSQKLRRNFRQEKRQRMEVESKESDFLDKNGLNLQLLPFGEKDEEMSRSVSFSIVNSLKIIEKECLDSASVKTRVMARSIFSDSSKDTSFELDNMVNKHRVKLDPFISNTNAKDEHEETKLITKNNSTKKTLELLSCYSSGDSD